MAETEKHIVNGNDNDEESQVWMEAATEEYENRSYDPDSDMEADFLFPEPKGST